MTPALALHRRALASRKHLALLLSRCSSVCKVVVAGVEYFAASNHGSLQCPPAAAGFCREAPKRDLQQLRPPSDQGFESCGRFLQISVTLAKQSGWATGTV